MIEISYESNLNRLGDNKTSYYRSATFGGYKLIYDTFEELSNFMDFYGIVSVSEQIWFEISCRDLPVWFIRKYQDKLKWDLISPNISSIDCLREFKDKIDWQSWCSCRSFNDEKIIKEFAEYIYLYYPLEKILSKEELELLKYTLLNKIKIPKRRIIFHDSQSPSDEVKASLPRRRIL